MKQNGGAFVGAIKRFALSKAQCDSALFARALRRAALTNPSVNCTACENSDLVSLDESDPADSQSKLQRCAADAELGLSRNHIAHDSAITGGG
jgi:hypothetical protein